MGSWSRALPVKMKVLGPELVVAVGDDWKDLKASHMAPKVEMMLAFCAKLKDAAGMSKEERCESAELLAPAL